MVYKIVIPEIISDLGKDFFREKGYEVTIGNGNKSVPYLKELISDADATLARTTVYSAEVLSAAKKLNVVGVHGVDYGNIDTSYCAQHNISVTTTPTATANAVAERTLGFIIKLGHQIPYMDPQVRNNNWHVRTEKQET